MSRVTPLRRSLSYFVIAVAIAAGAVTGCGQASTPKATVAASAAPSQAKPSPQRPAPTTDTPPVAATSAPEIVDAALAFFRAAARGDATTAVRWLTPPAQQRAAEEPTMLAGLGLAIASVDAGEVRRLSPNEAAVQLLVRETPEAAPQEVGCLLRLTADGWRVCGLASEGQPGGQPVVISLEPVTAYDDTVVDRRQPVDAGGRTARQPGAAPTVR